MQSGPTDKTGFYYVYILASLAQAGKYYTGFTENLGFRLRDHNSGSCPHTAKFRPWRIQTCVAFTDRERALAFERYLKSHSGRAFAVKHL
ncbi:MAG: GIY-YIG nuclease family protein [Lentisphaerae bacterium]|nr:GIY-YIG nuclease family protein [Lentisphaerota bacterium]